MPSSASRHPARMQVELVVERGELGRRRARPVGAEQRAQLTAQALVLATDLAGHPPDRGTERLQLRRGDPETGHALLLSMPRPAAAPGRNARPAVPICGADPGDLWMNRPIGRCCPQVAPTHARVSPSVRRLPYMRVDLTIRPSDGPDRDVAVVGPPGTRWAELVPLLAASTGAAPAWARWRPLRPDAVLGSRPMIDGAILTDTRPTGEDGSDGPRVEIVGGAGAGEGVRVGREPTTVGRAPASTLVLADPRVSRRHATLAITPTGVTVTDLGSTHGTWVDGRDADPGRPVPFESIVRAGDTFLAVTTPSEAAAATRAGPDGSVLFDRVLRRRPSPDDRIVVLPGALDERQAPRMQWIAAAIPLAAGAALAAVMHSVQLLAFCALSPLAMVVGTIGERVHWRRGRRRTVVQHRRATDAARREIAAALREEARVRRRAHPDPAAVQRIVRSPTGRLWERHRADSDLLEVRIGLGTARSALRVDRGGTDGPAATLGAVPCTLDLRAGAVGVTGPRRVAIARWLLVQLAALVSPADVEFALLVAADGNWTWARWLPHLHGRVATTPAGHDSLVDDLVELAAARRAVTGSPGSAWAGPWLVVMADRPAGDAAARLSALVTGGSSVGLSGVWLVGHAHELPAACVHSVLPADETGVLVRVGSSVVVADLVGRDVAERTARALAPLRDARADPAAVLPERSRLVSLLGEGPPSAADLRARWGRSDGSARTVLGVGATGPVLLDLDRDGPHVLVAGTTGSGKSELLQTIVAGLAALHPPDDITFLLVDYKGGAAFAECADLPHSLGLVTDLDEHLTRRVLASLDSEVRRRERLFAAAGARDLAGYRKGGAVLPRLILVVDEFATLADELPAFVPGLVSIAQRGRSLGLHLVLATQRPAGVVSPEIRANTAIRIALRTTTAADSVDVLDGPDAAAIDRRTPGRACLRIGTTTTVFQTAWAGWPAADTSPPVEVRVVPLDDWRRPLEPATASPVDTDLGRLVRAARGAAHDRAPVRRPWLPPLPTQLPAASLPEPVHPGSVAIGLLDLPREQRQDPLAIDLEAGEALLLVGGPRSGRTTALRTLAHAAARQRPPAALHLHAIDAAGGGLADLAAVPHTGSVASLHDGVELCARLVQRLTEELADRREARSSGRLLPALVLLVDGWEGLVAASEEYDGGRTIERLLGLIRDAAGSATTVAVTGGRGALSPRLAGVVGTRLVLPIGDADACAAAGLDPRTALPRRTPGRAIRTRDGIEAQLATPHPVDPAACGPADPGVTRLRALPRRVALADLPRSPGRLVLGVGGDTAGPLAVDLRTGAGRLVVAGPARSGRSTLLRSVLTQTPPSDALVAAPPRSPVAAVARDLGLDVLEPGDRPPRLPECALLIVDDVEAFTDTPAGDALVEWVHADRSARSVVVAGRADTLAVTFRGLPAELRRSGCGVLLAPGPTDGDVLGVSLPRTRPEPITGRGLLLPDPAWGLGELPLPIQVAAP